MTRPDEPRGEGALHVLPVAYADDRALIEALGARHPAAVRALWDRYAELVRRLLRRTLATDLVDDALQETFLRLVAKLPALEQVDRLRSFVVGVTMRVAREQLRRRKVRRWLSLTRDGVMPERPARAEDFTAAEALARLDALLARVDANTRVLFVLRFVEQTPAVEIAEAMGWSLATTKRRIRRARDRIERIAARDPVLADYVVTEPANEGDRSETGGARG